MADWAKASEDHRDYMVKDGVHLTGKGAAVYTRVIAEAAGVAAHLSRLPAIWPPVGDPGTIVDVVMPLRRRDARVAE